MTKILLLEDKPYVRAIIKHQLEFAGYRVDEAADIKAASRRLQLEFYDVVVMDLNLPDGRSISLFDSFAPRLDSRSILITGNVADPAVTEAINKGAFNCLEKPVEQSLLLAQVKRVLDLNALKEGHQALVNEVASNSRFDTIIYESRAMEAVVSRARVLARTGNTILIYGETGSGKEVLSQAMHNDSSRAGGTFMSLDCGSIAPELFESELFGFRKGAFPGAVGNYNGRFVQAHGGTLFMDEVGELPMYMQSKLLRVLDERSVFPLKAHPPIAVDVRLITATNRDLDREVKQEQFRSDLYYRLKESAIFIPPLRKRVADILPLARHFIHMYNHVFNKSVTGLSAEAENFFLTYSWRGNVRELKNVIKSIITYKMDDIIGIDDLSFSFMEGGRDTNGLTLAEGERRLITKVLKLTEFNITRSADVLGITRPRLYRKMKEYHLEVEDRTVMPNRL
ncbi:MAG: sigma-54-dependent Fis family transcriptional regulator [bacterium]|nr:sigma-54-dependent Fis family transcriptional regulator [bacterium]